MPLQIEIRRDGELVPAPAGWDGHMLSACFTVVLREFWPDMPWNNDVTVGELPTLDIDGKEVECSGDWTMQPIYLFGKHPLIGEGSYQLQEDHNCLVSDEDMEEHPLVLELKKGDIIKARRVMKSDV